MFNRLLSEFAKIFGGSFSDIAAIFTLLLTLYFFINYDVIRLGRVIKSFRMINTGLDSLKNNSDENIKKMNGLFGSRLHPALRKAWADYFREFNESGFMDALPDAGSHFTYDRLVHTAADRRKAEAVPGVLVIVGILAAFINIVIVLPGLDLPASGQAAENSYTVLANAVSSAFGICIIAIVASMLFQFLDRRFHQKAVAGFDEFLLTFSKKLPVMEINGGLTSGRSSFRETEAMLKAREIREEGILNAIDNLNRTLTKYSDDSLTLQDEGAKALVNVFMDRLNIVIGEQFGAITAGVQGILGYQIKTDKATYALVDQLTKNTELQGKAYSDIFALVEAIGGYQKQAEIMNGAITEGADLMSESLAKINEALETYKGESAALSEERRALQAESRALQTKSSEYLEKMDRHVDMLVNELNVQINTAFTRFNDITSVSFESLGDIMKTAIDDITGNLKSLIDSMDAQARDVNLYSMRLSEEMEELNEKLERSAGIFNDGLHKVVERSFNNFDEGLTEICMRFTNVISDIRDVVDELPAEIKAAGKDNDRKGVSLYEE